MGAPRNVSDLLSVSAHAHTRHTLSSSVMLLCFHILLVFFYGRYQKWKQKQKAQSRES